MQEKNYVYIISLSGTEAQRKGVIRSTIYVTFTSAFIKKLIETTDGTIYFQEYRDGTLYLSSDKYGYDHLDYVRQEVKKIAIAKIPDEPKENYEVTIDVTDFNFEELAEKIAKSRNRYMEIKALREELNNLIELKKEIVIKTYSSEVKLINDKRITFDINDPDSLRNAIAELQNLDVNKVLRETLEVKIQQLNEAECHIRKLESEIRQLKKDDNEEDDDC